MATDSNLVRDHFLAAAQLSAAEREAYLNAHCCDSELRAAVRRLLAAHDQPASVLDRPVANGQEQTGSYIPGEQPGGVIAGRYKLLEEIGEGGMGTVWVAEQSQPVRRKVALKLVKAGMDSKSILARFEAEKQALAVMDHPNIAKVLDGGLTENGRSYPPPHCARGLLTAFGVTEALLDRWPSRWPGCPKGWPTGHWIVSRGKPQFFIQWPVGQTMWGVMSPLLTAAPLLNEFSNGCISLKLMAIMELKRRNLTVAPSCLPAHCPLLTGRTEDGGAIHCHYSI